MANKKTALDDLYDAQGGKKSIIGNLIDRIKPASIGDYIPKTVSPEVAAKAKDFYSNPIKTLDGEINGVPLDEVSRRFRDMPKEMADRGLVEKSTVDQVQGDVRRGAAVAGALALGGPYGAATLSLPAWASVGGAGVGLSELKSGVESYLDKSKTSKILAPTLANEAAGDSQITDKSDNNQNKSVPNEAVNYYADGLDRMMNATSFGPGSSASLKRSKLEEYADTIAKNAEKKGINVTAGQILEQYAKRGADPLPQDKVQAAAILAMQAIPAKGDKASAPLEAYAAELGVDPKDVKRRIDKIGNREEFLKKEEGKQELARNRSKELKEAGIDSSGMDQKEITAAWRGMKDELNKVGASSRSKAKEKARAMRSANPDMSPQDAIEFSVADQKYEDSVEKYKKFSWYDKMEVDAQGQRRFSNDVDGGPTQRQQELLLLDQAHQNLKDGKIDTDEFGKYFRKDGTFSPGAYKRETAKIIQKQEEEDRQRKIDTEWLQMVERRAGIGYEQSRKDIAEKKFEPTHLLRTRYGSLSPKLKNKYRALSEYADRMNKAKGADAETRTKVFNEFEEARKSLFGGESTYDPALLAFRTNGM